MSVTKTLFPLVSVDVALFSIERDRLGVLLVKRANEPELHRWALPGGVLKPDLDANLESAARRVLQAKISVDVPHLEEVRTFSGAERDPRGWSVAVLFYALLPADRVQAVISSKIEEAKWAPAARTGHRLAFDHDRQLDAALGALRRKVEEHTLPLHLLPSRFTLTALQHTCELILERRFDKAAFRRRLKTSSDLQAVPGEFVRGVQRPAQLYEARPGFTFARSSS